MACRYRIVLAAVLSGCAYAVAQPPYAVAGMAYVALVPWLVVSRGLGARRGAWLGLGVGLVAGALCGHWAFGVLRQLAADVAVAALGVLLLALFALGIPFSLVGAVASARWVRDSARVIMLAGLWAGLDAIQLYHAWGVPYTLLGHSQASASGVAQLAAAGGVPLVSALVAGANAGLALAFVAWREREAERASLWLAGVVAAIGLPLALGAPLARALHPTAMDPRAGDLELLAIQPNLPSEERWARRAQRTNLALTVRRTRRELDAMVAGAEKHSPREGRFDTRGSDTRRTQRAASGNATPLSRSAPGSGTERPPDSGRRQNAGQVLDGVGSLPDVIVWPETLLTTPLDAAPELRADLLGAVADFGAPTILGVADVAPSGRADRYTNAVLWVDPEHGVVARSEKTRGVPGVEVADGTPLAQLFATAVTLREGARLMEPAQADTPLDGPGVRFAVVLCYEALFPGLVAARRPPDAAAILALSDDTWFAAPGVSAQLIAMTRFRAIEQRLTLVRVAHGGVSAVVDPLGRVVATLGFGDAGALRATVRSAPPPWAGERAALLALPLGGAATGVALAAAVLRRRSPHIA